MGGSLSCCMPTRSLPPPKSPSPSGPAVHAVELAVSELVRLPGLGTAYHTSVVVHGQEFFFSDSGISANGVFASHNGNPGQIIKLGYTHRTGGQLIQALWDHFSPGTYDLIHKNCNSFTDCALALLLNQRLDRKYSQAERIGQWAGPQMCEKIIGYVAPGAYRLNKAASTFKADHVVTMLQKLSDADLEPKVGTARRARSTLAPRARVTIVGLEKAQHLNGQGATVVRYNGVSGRWEARLELTGELKAFRAENLRPQGELALRPGDAVKVHSLRSEAGQLYNDKEGTILRYLHDAARYEVQVGGEARAFKAENLLPL